jgi:hypothetical protein
MADDRTGDAGSGTRSPSSPDAIEQAIEIKRAQLASTIDELSERAHPREIARRGIAGVTARAQGAVRTPDGRLRTERVGAVAAALVVLLVALIRVRRRR